jgi:uncharacterized protein YjbI with pentapeptide repeats
MLSPLLLVRAVSGIAMPMAVGAVYIKRRRVRRGQRQEPVTEPRHPGLDYQEFKRRLEEGADLSGADLTGARLDRMDLHNRRLSGLNLSRASLRRAALSGTDLSGSRLDHADFSGADMRGANLTEVSLLETIFWKADLSGADLSGSRQLVMAGLRRARFDATTRWPPGFDPSAAGAEPKRRH